MKSYFAILLAGLFALSVFPGTAIAGPQDQASIRQHYPVELRSDAADDRCIPAGPRRDLGPDWIIYDNGQPQWLRLATDYWSRQIFTPNAAFELMAIRFMPYNRWGINVGCDVLVYSEDQDNNDLDELLWEGEINRVPQFNFDDINSNWLTIELDEDDYITFEGGENFSLIYGPAPGGPDADNRNAGFWHLFDSDTREERSFIIVGDIENDHDDWDLLTGDLLLRANGEYQDEFIDVVLTNLYNDNGGWIMYPETEQTFIAELTNEGDDVDVLVVTFDIFDSDGNSVLEEPVSEIVQDFEAEETIEVEMEDPWSPEEAGLYTVEAIVQAENEANEDNNFGSFEQIVINPEDENDADMWIGYCDDDPNSSIVGGDSTGWITAFRHPGGDQQLWVTALRWFLDNSRGQNDVECNFAIATFNGENQYGWVWQGAADAEAQEAGWVEIVLDEEEYDTTSFGEGEETWCCYFYSGLTLQMDGTPPIAGSNPEMLATMYQTNNLGRSAGASETGDYMCQIKLGISNVVPDGPYLSIEPDPVEFGDDLYMYQEYTVDATFRSYGTETVEIRMIQIAPGGRDYLTVEPDAFDIESEEEQEVTITFLATEAVGLATRLMVINNSDNMNNAYVWNVTATAERDPLGPNLWIAPAELDFGDIVTGMDFWLETVVTSVGTEAAAVFEIQIPEELAGFVSVEPTDFELEAGAEQTVTVTINSEFEFELDGDLIIVNNANNIDNNFALHVSAAITAPPEGSHLRFQLPALDFGDYLALDEDYVIETEFISIGLSPVTISGITIPEEAADVITVDPSVFVMGPLSRQTVTVTFNTSVPVDLETALIVLNNSDNIDNEFEWPVTALTAPILTIDLDAIDFGEGLSICETYNVVANFTSIGSNPVIVSMIAIDQVAAATVTINPTEFEVADGTQEVTFSLNSHELIELETTVEIVHNAINLENPHVMNVHISVLDVEEDAQAGIPGEYSLSQNYPNPFNPLTTVEFGLKAAGDVRLDVYNMNGRLIKQVLNSSLNAGYHSVEIDASDLPAGIYIYRLNAGEFSSARKMILLK